MKTIITTLPIYDKLVKQAYERAKAGNIEGIIPIVCPRHRLPSFQWLDDTDGCASVSKIEIVDSDSSATDITAKFTLPTMIPLEHDYFVYSGTTLLSILTAGIYYLKITMNDAKIYYSDWFKVDCVFGTDENLPPTLTYSDKYLIINFLNSCDFGNIYYHGGFNQSIWLKSEPLEMTFPLEEEGAKNGEGQFVRTFGRQTKKYLLRTNKLPDFMVDVFHRMKLHDTIELIDLLGDAHTIYNLEVEHEWLDVDKYYAKIDLTFDYDETVVIAGCCNNIV